MNPITDEYGITEWRTNGKLHRIDGPAVIYPDKNYSWFIEGEMIRSADVYQQKAGLTDEQMTFLILTYGSPTVIYPIINPIDGAYEWHDKHGQLHRDDGPARLLPHIEEWYQHGELHRDYAPAVIVEFSGAEHWYQHGKRHRIDGPASTSLFDNNEWCIRGELICSIEIFQRKAGLSDKKMARLLRKYSGLYYGDVIPLTK